MLCLQCGTRIHAHTKPATNRSRAPINQPAAQPPPFDLIPSVTASEIPVSRVIDYFLAPHSPWTYLGHERFVAIAREAGATGRPIPIDLLQLFSVSGGLPLSQRPAQRQAYRLLELRRFSRHLGMPMHVEPTFFPVVPHTAARLIIAVDEADGAEAALRLTGALLRAVWEQQRDIADAATLTAILGEQALPAERLARSA